MTPHSASIARGMLTQADVIAEFNITRQTLYRWRKSREIIAYRFKRSIRFKRTDIEKFMEAAKQ